MITFTVEADEAGLRPDRLLRRRRPRIDRELALKILKDGRIVVNGATARLATKVTAGQVVQVSMSEERAGPPATAGLSVVHAADGVVVVDKPAGLAMHTGTGVEDDAATLHGLLARAFPSEEGFAGPSFLGRLDRPTSGLVVAALSRAGLTSVEPAWRRGALEKGYLVLVHGKTPPQGRVEIPLAARRPRHRGTGRVEEAVTVFRTLGATKTASLLLCEPRTGRTHQIRRHMKAIGHPVVGDDRYGDIRRDKDLPGSDAGLMLHAWRYRHEGDVPALPRVLEAPCPPRIREAAKAATIDVDTALARGVKTRRGIVDDETTATELAVVPPDDEVVEPSAPPEEAGDDEHAVTSPARPRARGKRTPVVRQRRE